MNLHNYRGLILNPQNYNRVNIKSTELQEGLYWIYIVTGGLIWNPQNYKKVYIESTELGRGPRVGRGGWSQGFYYLKADVISFPPAASQLSRSTASKHVSETWKLEDKFFELAVKTWLVLLFVNSSWKIVLLRKYNEYWIELGGWGLILRRIIETCRFTFTLSHFTSGTGSEEYSLRISRTSGPPIAPRASAHSWRTIGSLLVSYNGYYLE